jgi:hypothetical protein
MRDAELKVLQARLESLERIIDAAVGLSPYAHEFATRADQDAIGRIRDALCAASRQALRLRLHIRPLADPERADIACATSAAPAART